MTVLKKLYRVGLSLRVPLLLTLLVSPFTLQTALSSCDIRRYIPQYMSYAEFREQVVAAEPKVITQPGNILVYGDYLLLVDVDEGIHLIDNENPSNPTPVSFIPVLGAAEIAVVDDMLYAKSFIDLVVIDISVPSQAAEISRLEGFYPPLSKPGVVSAANESQGVVIGYEISGEFVACEDGGGGCMSGGASGADVAAEPPQAGQAGSLSAIIVVNQHLYSLTDNALKSASVADAANPVEISSVAIDRRNETIFYHDNALYIGGQVGVYIFDLTDPDFPQAAGVFEHQWQCDPVVVNGDIAYATLRSGANCAGLANELNVLDVSDIQAPVLIDQIPLENPHGLAIEGDILFIADGQAGLKIYNAADPANLTQVGQWPNVVSWDVIVENGWGVLVGPRGLVQFQYNENFEISLVSALAVQKN